MEIKHGYIFGFGQWVDYSIDFSKNSLTCVFGENESGKSTLQKFILFMLFGLPPKARQFYRPKTSGKMGGRLTMIDYEAGEFTIERIDEVKNGAAICYGVNGKTYDEIWLKDKLNGMTDRIYQSIFSFSALDLIHFKKMKDEDLGEILLSIGLTGSNHVYETEKKLDQQIGELFKPFGKVPAINKQLDLLDSLKKEMDDQLQNERTYRHKKEQLEEIVNDINLLTWNVKQKKETLVSIDRKKHALPLLEDYYNLQEQLGKFPANMTYPQNGLDRLHFLKDKLLPLKSEWSIIKSNQKEAHKNLIEIKSNLLDETVLSEAKEIRQRKNAYIKSEHALNSLQESLRQLSVKISTKLDELNLGISEQELHHVSFPFQIEKRWNELRVGTEKLEIEKGQVHQEKSSLQKQRNYLFNQLYELESVLLEEKHRVELEQRIQLNKSNEFMETIIAETNQKRKEWQKTKKEKERNTNRLLIGSISIGTITLFVAYFFNIPSLFYIGFLLLAIGAGQWGWRRQSLKQMERFLTVDTPTFSPRHAFSVEERLEAEQLLEQHEKSKQTIASIQSQLKTVEGQLVNWTEKESKLTEREHQLKEQMEIEQRRYPFLRQVQVAYWPDMYFSMNQLLGLIREKIACKEEYEKLKEEQQHRHEQLLHFVKKIMEIRKEDHELLLKSAKHNIDVLFDFIDQLLAHQSDFKRLQIQTEDLIKENNKRQTELKEKLNVYEQEMNALFIAAGVNTEDAFYQKSKDAETKNRLEHTLRELSTQLSTMLSQADLELLNHENTDKRSLESDYESTKENIEELENLIDQKRQEAADLNAIIASMETSEMYSNMMHQFNIEIEQMQKLAKKWAVLKTAKEVLTSTKRKYREKYLTKVIKETTHYFIQITDGKYKEVLPPMDGDVFQIVAHDGIRYKVDELSQGTVDQLYISLRLAISYTMSQDFRLPFIIDDAFVHFDDTRTDRMINILKDIAHHQQVILFTCKPHIRQQVLDANVIHLEKPYLIS